MKAKLLRFEVEKTMVTDGTPEIHKLVMKDGDRLMSDFSNMVEIPTSMDVDYNREIYKLLPIYRENGTREYYYVDEENVKDTILVVNEIIKRNTRDLEKLVEDLKILSEQRLDKIKELQKKKWWQIWK